MYVLSVILFFWLLRFFGKRGVRFGANLIITSMIVIPVLVVITALYLIIRF